MRTRGSELAAPCFACVLALAAHFKASAIPDPLPAHASAGFSSASCRSDVIGVAELPAQAQATLRLIKRGGPFPYSKDGSTFGNREGRLPARGRGYYKEYTVPSRSSLYRGARRIIAGARGEFYYTDDHYNSFRLIKE
jgi:ribonuclease T1